MRLHLLPRAQRDLLEVEAWLEREKPQTWAKHLDAVIAASSQLERYPRSGSACRDTRLETAGFRTLFADRFVIFYKLQRHAVYVYRILHQRQTWDRLL